MEAPTFSTPKSDDPQQGWIIASVRISEGHGRFLGKHPDPKVKAGTDYGKTMEKQPWKHRMASPRPPQSPYGSDCTFRVVGPVSVEQQQNQVLTAGSAKTGRQRTTTAVCWSSPAAVGPPAVVGPPAAVGPKGPLDKLDWPLDSNLFPMAPLHIISESPTSSPTSRSRQLTDERSHPCRTGTQTQPNIQST